MPSVVGLLPGDKDVAVRVNAGCSAEALQAVQAQVQFILEDRQAQFRRPVPGQRWWRLGPLTEAECWRLQEMVAATGLEPLRGELRVARMGPFRSAVYFAATGEPTKRSLDDGSWSASEARLTPAEPPPRRQPGGLAASRAPLSRDALPAGSSWAGPRRPQPQPGVPSAAASLRPGQDRPRAPSPTPASRRSALRGHADFPPLSAAAPGRSGASLLPEASGARRRNGGGQPPVGAIEARLDRLLEQLERLQQQNADLAGQLAQLREENHALRRQLAPMSHQPYAPLPSGGPQSAAQSAVRPRTPPRDPPSRGDVEMVPGWVPDPKRSRLQPALEFRDAGAEPVPPLGNAPGHGL